jgi:thiol-disulfide isomerase/thioredoxin
MSCASLALRAAAVLAIVGLAGAGPAAQTNEYAAELAKADAALKERAYQDALKSYKRANSKAGNKSADAWYGAARVHLALGEPKAAIDACKDALKHVADNHDLAAQIYNLRGVAFTQQSEKPDDKPLRLAEGDLRQALELRPDLTTVRYNLGLVLLKMGRDADGVAEMREFLSRDPNASGAAEARRMIANPRRARELFAPAFSFVSLDGRTLTLEELRGKTVLLDFWGTWCPPCRAATPDLIRLAKKFGDRQFVIVGISSDKSAQVVTDYVSKNAIAWPQFVDLQRTIHRAYGVTVFPTYVIIDHEGVVRGRRTSYSTQVTIWLNDEIKRTIELQEKSVSQPATPR